MKPDLSMILISVLAASSAVAAFSADGKGNGGQAVVCGAKAMMLDHYEGLRREFGLNLGEPALSVRKKVRIMTDRIRKFQPDVAEAMDKELEPMLIDVEAYATLPTHRLPNGVTIRTGKTLLWTDEPLRIIQDSGIGFEMAAGCKLVQAIRNQPLQVPEDREYEINTKAWLSFNNDEKSIGLAHEVLYKLTRKVGETDSYQARYLNQYLMDGSRSGSGVCDFYNEVFPDTAFSKIGRAWVSCDGKPEIQRFFPTSKTDIYGRSLLFIVGNLTWSTSGKYVAEITDDYMRLAAKYSDCVSTGKKHQGTMTKTWYEFEGQPETDYDPAKDLFQYRKGELKLTRYEAKGRCDTRDTRYANQYDVDHTPFETKSTRVTGEYDVQTGTLKLSDGGESWL